MKARLPIALVAVAVCVLAEPALAQPGRGRPGAPPALKAYLAPRPMQLPAAMSQEQRERFRQELNSARDLYREQNRPPDFDPRRAPQRPMPPEERERLRRDIQNANRDFEQRR